jgi:hypothetical protein
MLKRKDFVPKLGRTKKPKQYPIKYILLSDIFFYLEDYNERFNLYSRNQLLNRNYSIFEFDLLMFGSIKKVNISELIRKLIHRYRYLRSTITKTIAKRDIDNAYLKDTIKEIRLLRHLKKALKDEFIYIWLDCTGA